MSEFTIHTRESAPQKSRNLLKKAEEEMGFIPHLYGVMAESPATLKAYQILTALFDKTAFTVTERQLVLITINQFRNSSYCLRAHTALAKTQKISMKIVYAVYFNKPIDDIKLEALRTFTRTVLENDGWVEKPTLKAFYQAGYQKKQVLEVVLAVSFKTLSNYVNQINDTLIDEEFLSGILDIKNTPVNDDQYCLNINNT